MIGRLGGDEFGALLTRPTSTGAKRVIGDLLAALRRGTPDIPGGTSLRASIGSATAPGTDADYAALLSSAEGNMYVRKRADAER